MNKAKNIFEAADILDKLGFKTYVGDAKMLPYLYVIKDICGRRLMAPICSESHIKACHPSESQMLDYVSMAYETLAMLK